MESMLLVVESTLLKFLLEHSPYGLWIATAALCIWLGIRLGFFQRDMDQLRLSINALTACHKDVEEKVHKASSVATVMRLDHERLRVGTEAIDERVERIENVLGGVGPRSRR